MASTSVKIFNDTVLKQSVLQGYEVQRTNDNLGRFTMGELAFTRDTGRLFIGNYTGNNTTINSADSSYVAGGILTGNKYLGFIDSKPLIHFSTSGSTGWKPLSYEENTVDPLLQENGTETGLFLSGSRFRQDDGEEGNGWNKKSEFIEKYGVYSGDYTFDIYNNALIIFDKNITTSQLSQPKRKIVTDADGKYEEQIIDDKGENVSHKSKRRTPLYNDLESANADYPIYGDGYVIMRLIEPDGITIGYKDRTFIYQDGNVNSDGSPTTVTNSRENWSHNLLTIKKVPATALTDTFDAKQFHNDGKLISLEKELPGIEAIKGEDLTLPSNLTIKSYNGNEWTDDTELNFSFSNPPSQFSTTNPYTDYILTLLPEKFTDGEIEKVKYNATIQKQYLPEYRIVLHDGLINTASGLNYLTINQQNSDTNLLHLGYQPSEDALSNPIGYVDPLKIGEPSDFVYSGTNSYTLSGGLHETETYDSKYSSAAQRVINQFDTDGNVAYNLLKNPTPICWSYPSTDEESYTFAKLDFIINPFIQCIKKQYTSAYSLTDGEKTERLYELTIDGVLGEDGLPTQPTSTFPDYYITDVIVLGNNDYDSATMPSNISLIDGLSFSINNENLYKTKILGNTNTTKILSLSPVENNTSMEDDEMYQSGRQKYYKEIIDETTINYYPIYLDDNNYQIFKKDVINSETNETEFQWYFVPNQIPTPTEGETPSVTDVDDDGLPSKQYIESCIVLKNTSISASLNSISAPEIITSSNYKNTDYSSVFTMYTTSTIIESENGNTTQTQFIFNSSDNDYDDFAEFFENAFIRKIEITSNSTSENIPRFVTLFDREQLFDGVNIENLNVGVYHPHDLTTLIVSRDQLTEQKKYECCYNSKLFINKEFAPYVLQISYILEGDVNVRTRLFPLRGDITYSNIVPITETAGDYTLGGEKLQTILVDGTEMSVEQFYNTHYDSTTSTITNLDTLNDNLMFISSEQLDVQLTTDQPIYDLQGWDYDQDKIHNFYYKWNNEISYYEKDKLDEEGNLIKKGELVVLTIKYQGSGNISDRLILTESGELNPDYIVTEVLKNGVALSPEQIKTLVQDRIIPIPTAITIPFKSPSVITYLIKEIPTHPDGYVYSTSISKENQVIIPETASSLVLEIHHFTTSNSDVTIYSAASMDDLGTKKTITNEDLTTQVVNYDVPYQFPFKLTLPEEGVPGLVQEASINDKEKVLYHSNTSDVQVIDVPLYKTTIDMSKGFSLRVANMPCGGNEDKFLIRVIGYRV